MNWRSYEDFCEEYKDCLKNVEQSYGCINNNDTIISQVGTRAFILDMIELFDVLESYTSCVLKNYNNIVCGKTTVEIFDKCEQLGKLDKELNNKIKSSVTSQAFPYNREDKSIEIPYYLYTLLKDDLINQYNLMMKEMKKCKKTY